MMLHDYEGKEFVNVCTEDTGLGTDEEKESIKAENEGAKDMLDFMKQAIGGDISSVRFTNTLKDHPVCIASEGPVSASMEKTLGRMPGAENAIKAEKVLEINIAHPIAERLKALFGQDNDKLADYSRLLYANARLISGLPIEDPAAIGELMTKLMLDN